MVTLFTANAINAQDYTMTFAAGNDVCTPITVRVGGKSYTVYTSVTIKRISGSVTATDCNGRKLRYDYSTRGNSGSSSHDTYTFHNAYDANYDSSRSNSNNGGYPNNNAAYNSGYRAGQAVASAIFGLGGGADGEAYPGLSIMPGLSYARGENLKLAYKGSGFHMYGNIGKDFLFDTDYSDKLLWNVGLGSYFAFGDDDPAMDISLGLSIGQLSTWEKLSLMIDMDYTYWLGRWRRVGMFAGGSLGWGSFAEVFSTDDYSSYGGFAWNLEIGLAIRIANF